MATHSSMLAWRIPMDRGAWWAMVHKVAKSWTWLKWFSMHAWPGNSTSVYLSEENKNTNSERYMYLCDHCSIIHNSQNMDTTQVPINRWVDKEVVIHTRTHMCMCIYDGILFNHKKWNLAICNNIGGPRRYELMWNKPEKDNYCMISLIWNLKKQNKWTNTTKHRTTNTENKQVVARRQVGYKDERSRWMRLWGTNFQSQNEWVTGIKCTVWGI